MKITWFGQACFEIVTQSGAVVVCDPYHPLTGYPPHPRNADIITISHEHADHNCTDWILGLPQVLRGAGSWEIHGVRALGLPSFHDGQGGAQRGPNTIFLLEVDGFRLCHLGDLGHRLDSQTLLKIRKPDVLFVPAGGFYTLEPAEAAETVRSIAARLTVPMHFSTGVRETPLASVDEFARETGAERMNVSSIDFSRNYDGPGVAILEYLR